MSMPLVPDQASLFWTGHSARRVLPTISAAIGCPKEDRDFLGRWAIGRTGSNAYMLTSGQIVERIQRQVVGALQIGESRYHEDEILEELKSFSAAHGIV